MKGAFLLLFVGGALIAGAFGLQSYFKELQASEVRGVAVLETRLDSARAALTRATTSEDSTRRSDEVREREYYLARRRFHIPARQASINAWWQLGSAGSLMVIGGVVLLVAGAIVFATGRRAA